MPREILENVKAIDRDIYALQSDWQKSAG